MIPTFVITLREGVEASLIVGIIATFLVKEGREDAMRQMWLGVAIAIACQRLSAARDIDCFFVDRLRQDYEIALARGTTMR